MTTERQEKISFLLRKNAGDKKHPDCKQKLSKILGTDPAAISFLPLEQSDRVRDAFFEEVRRNEEEETQSRTKVSRASWDLLHQVLLKIRDSASDRTLYILLPDADSVGAFPLAERDFLLHAVSLYQEFNESICAVDPLENSSGIMIDYFDDFYSGVVNFDAVFYGKMRELLLSLQ